MSYNVFKCLGSAYILDTTLVQDVYVVNYRLFFCCTLVKNLKQFKFGIRTLETFLKTFYEAEPCLETL